MQNNKSSETDKVIEVLNDLIAINNERMLGYEQASFQSHVFNLELRRTFALFANLSRQNIYELRQDIIQLQSEPVRLIATGWLFGTWTDSGAHFDLQDRQTALESCVRGEYAIQAAYKKALETSLKISQRVIDNLQRQLGKLQTAAQIVQQYNPSTIAIR